MSGRYKTALPNALDLAAPPAWRAHLGRTLVIAFAIKILVLTLLWWLFFSGAPHPMWQPGAAASNASSSDSHAVAPR
jgi:hypothetical protein